MSNLSRRDLIKAVMASAAIGSGFTLVNQAQAKGPLKIAFIYVSPAGDAGWTYQHDLGRKAVEAAFGAQVQVTVVGPVSEGPDAERVLTGLCSKGFGLIFATSFGYMNAVLKVAQKFPEVEFEHATGYKRAANVATYATRLYEGMYLGGMAAGAMSKTHLIGYVAAFPIPEVVRAINAFTLGAQKMNPKIQTKVIWVNSWYDPPKARQAAEALIAQGCDVLTHHTDSPAVVQTCEDKGVYSVAHNTDMTKFAPKTQLAAVELLWSDYYIERVRRVLDDKWQSGDVWGGLGVPMVDLTAMSQVMPQSVHDAIKQTKADIIAGKFHPFQGEIKDSKGKVWIAKGKVMSDEEMLGINKYVLGVEGSVPS